MKATDLVLGTDYRVEYIGARCRLTGKGSGHGEVHQVQVVDVETGDLKDPTTYHNCSSRSIIETWESFLLRNPDFVARTKAQEREREENAAVEQEKKKFTQMLRDMAGETAALLSALGFEAEVCQVGVYRQSSVRTAPYPFEIVIANPQQNQDLLRRMVAEKWGVSPHGQDEPVTPPTDNATEPTDLPEDQ